MIPGGTQQPKPAAVLDRATAYALADAGLMPLRDYIAFVAEQDAKAAALRHARAI